MKNLRIGFNLLAGTLLALALTATANAQASRTWVSGVGDDANPCSRTAPCKTWAGAISKTAAGGEIDALDPAGYGAVTITKSITLDGDIGVNSVLVSGTNGIVVAAGATDRVSLRNLMFNGLQGSGISGVQINSAGVVHLENLDIFGFQTGVNVTGGAKIQLTMENVTILDSSTNGIALTTTVSNVVTDIHNVRVFGCGTAALSAGAGTLVSVRDSVMGYCGTASINQTAAGSNITVIGSMLDYSANGVQSHSGSQVSVSGNSLVGNGLAFNTNSGTILSDNTNSLVANGANGSVTASGVTKL